MGHDVFISHATADKAIALAVSEGLEKRGVKCWLACREFAGGENWAREIVEAIDTSKVTVVIFSAAANESLYVLREVTRSADKKIPIVPFWIEKVEPQGGLALYFGLTHRLGAMEGALEGHIERLGKVVEKLLKPAEAKVSVPPVATSAEAQRIEEAPKGATKTTPVAQKKVVRGTKVVEKKETAPLSAEELREITNLRAGAMSFWRPLEKVEGEPALVKQLERGRKLFARMEESFGGDRFREAEVYGRELMEIMPEILRIKGERDRAATTAERTQGVEREARGFDAGRLAEGIWQNGVRFWKQGTEAYWRGEFGHAEAHWREAEKEFRAAVKMARPTRIKEVRDFVERVDNIYSRGWMATKEGVTDLAGERAKSFLDEKQAEALLGATKKLPAGARVPDSLIAKVLQGGDEEMNGKGEEKAGVGMKAVHVWVGLALVMVGTLIFGVTGYLPGLIVVFFWMLEIGAAVLMQMSLRDKQRKK